MRTVINGRDVLDGDHLSKREMDTLQLVAQGKRYADIGELLHCKAEAIRARMRRIMDRFGTSTAAGVVSIAYQRGILTIPNTQREQHHGK